MLLRVRLKELTPETALEQLKQATNVEGMLYVLRDVIEHFALAVSRAEADDKVKAKAILHLGQIEDALSALGEFFSAIIELHPPSYTEERLYRSMKEYIADLISIYADIRNGKPLDDVAVELEFEVRTLREAIRDYARLIGSDIKNLFKEPEEITIKL